MGARVLSQHTSCIVCHRASVELLLSLGEQAMTNRFLHKEVSSEFKHPLKVGICSSCALMQLVDPAPVTETKPRFDWMTYMEPEDHLDELVEHLMKLPGLDASANIGAITYKDDTTLDRFVNRGWKQTYRLDPAKDLGILDPSAGIETIQERLTVTKAKEIVVRQGAFDLVTVRHILEHAYDVKEFIKGLKALLTPNGYLLFEVPDCTKALASFDCTTLWEEHIVYFTPATYQHALSVNGLTLHDFSVYPYAFEGSMVAITQASESATSVLSKEITLQETDRIRLFVERLLADKEVIKAGLAKFTAGHEKGKAVVFGAGHLSCMFINVMGIEDSISVVLDDNSHKMGLLMPGSQLPIVGSQFLLENLPSLCLLGINPLNEKKVIEKNKEYREKGGEFVSIFPHSERYILKWLV
jgi:hypothetical protein